MDGSKREGQIDITEIEALMVTRIVVIFRTQEAAVRCSG